MALTEKQKAILVRTGAKGESSDAISEIDGIPIPLLCRLAAGLESRPYLRVDCDRIVRLDASGRPVSTLSGWLPPSSYGAVLRQYGPKYGPMLNAVKEMCGFQREMMLAGRSRPQTGRGIDAGTRDYDAAYRRYEVAIERLRKMTE